MKDKNQDNSINMLCANVEINRKNLKGLKTNVLGDQDSKVGGVGWVTTDFCYA